MTIRYVPGANRDCAISFSATNREGREVTRAKRTKGTDEKGPKGEGAKTTAEERKVTPCIT
jgi:hypothetical protein